MGTRSTRSRACSSPRRGVISSGGTKPAADLSVERDRTHRRLFDPPLGRMEDERVALPAPESSMRADLVLEWSHLARLRLEHAHDDEVPAFRHGVEAPKALRGVRPKSRQRIDPLHMSERQIMRATASKDDGSAAIGADHDEPDPRMPDEAVHETRVGRV